MEHKLIARIQHGKCCNRCEFKSVLLKSKVGKFGLVQEMN